MTQHSGQATVLVVEDQPTVRLVASEALRDSGLNVFEASDADEALFILGLHPEVDLLFTDLNMPGGMDGCGLAVRAFNNRPDLRLVMTSGRERLSDRSLPDHGKFLPKPYNAHQLVALVHRELRRGDAV